MNPGAAPTEPLEAALTRLRLLLRKRLLWLRQGWSGDPLSTERGIIITDAEVDGLLAGSAGARAAEFFAQHPEAATLDAQIARLDESPQPPAILHAAEVFGLGPVARETLLLCLAHELEPGFGRLCGYAQDDVQLRHPTIQLAAALFAEPGRDALAEFAPDAPLFRFALLRVEPQPGLPRGQQPLAMDPSLAEFFRTARVPAPAPTDGLRPVEKLPLSAELETSVQTVLRWMAAQPGAPVNLVGPADCGKEAVAARVAEALGKNLLRFDTARLSPDPVERAAMLRRVERDARLQGCGLFCAGGSEWNGELLNEWQLPLILGTRGPVEARRPVLRLTLAAPGKAARREFWQQALGAEVDEAELEQVLHQYEFGPRATARAASALRARCAAGGEPATLWSICREQGAAAPADLAQLLTGSARWGDLLLPPDQLSQLRAIEAQLRHRGQVHGKWGFDRQLERAQGVTVLFSGPSGTGKTLAAEVLANELEIDIFRIDLAGLFSKYIGETAKHVREVFDYADRHGKGLFLDEADALLARRSDVKESRDRYANLDVNYLLQRMEAFRGLAILATNRRHDVDRAFLRRLRFVVEFPFPDEPMRRRLWEHAFPPAAGVQDLDLEMLGRLELSGGNIRTIAINSAFAAAAESSEITLRHVLGAARHELAKLEKLMAHLPEPKRAASA